MLYMIHKLVVVHRNTNNITVRTMTINRDVRILRFCTRRILCRIGHLVQN